MGVRSPTKRISKKLTAHTIGVHTPLGRIQARSARCCVDQLCHTFETEVGFHRHRRRCCRTATATRTPIYPRRRQSDCLCRYVIVEEALRDV